jgi:hypothetical protein
MVSSCPAGRPVGRPIECFLVGAAFRRGAYVPQRIAAQSTMFPPTLPDTFADPQIREVRVIEPNKRPDWSLIAPDDVIHVTPLHLLYVR